MKLKEKLKIVLITYNRKEKLRKTLSWLFDDNSPVKDLDITILDNASTDGTSELIQEYKQKFPNIEHIKHPNNIGGNANICRALEIGANCNKEYFWILCDDDTLRFNHWQEVEQAILSGKYDCIIVEKKIKFSDSQNYPYIINTLSFLPAGIYKTCNIDSNVLFNAYNNIMYYFPHLALGCHLLNIKGKFYIPKYRVIKQGIPEQNLFEIEDKKEDKKDKNDFVRGVNEEAHFRTKQANLYSGLINSYQMITDKKLRAECCNVLYIGKSFIGSVLFFIETNKYINNNLFDFFLGINLIQKIQFIFALFLYLLLCIIYIYKTPNGIYIRLFNVLKTKLIPFKKNKKREKYKIDDIPVLDRDEYDRNIIK